MSARSMSTEIRRSFSVLGDVVMYELPKGRGYVVTYGRPLNPNAVRFTDRKEAFREFFWRAGVSKERKDGTE